MIYLDNSATSPIDEEVYEAMLPYLKEEYGNPSSKYYRKAVNAKNAVYDARDKVAKLIGASSENIIFTSGATESANLIIKGYMDYRRYYGDGKNHIITSVAEHKATLNVCKYLNGEIYSNNDPTYNLFGIKRKVDRGYEASFIGVDKYGAININELSNNITDKTAMLSVIYVNNEIGTINDIKEIKKVIDNKKISLHIDATQAIGKINVNVKELGCDYLSCSAHKLYGPKGIGAAYLKTDKYGIEPISAFIHGGEQENGYRAGTLSVHNIIGFGKAAEIAVRDLNKNIKKIDDMDNYFLNKIANIASIKLTNPTSNRVKGIISIIIEKDNFNNELFIKKISDKVAISTGSACSAGEPSHVIKGIGIANKTNKVLRITLNKYNTISDIDELIEIFNKI